MATSSKRTRTSFFPSRSEPGKRHCKETGDGKCSWRWACRPFSHTSAGPLVVRMKSPPEEKGNHHLGVAAQARRWWQVW